MSNLQQRLYAERYARTVRFVNKVIDFVGTAILGVAMAWILVNGFFPA